MTEEKKKEMSILSKALNMIKYPERIIFHLNLTPFQKLIPNKFCLKCIYKTRTGRKLNLKNPVLFNEKLQWLKLYNHQDIYTTMVDKYEAKKFIGDRIGYEYVIENLGVWDSVDDIDVSALPDQFVLKSNHDSKGIYICTDKNTFDLKNAKAFLKKHLDFDYFYAGREWPYKNVKRRIIAERYMKDLADGELRDYKFFCFDGEPKALYITQGRDSENETVADFFDMEFNHLDMKIDHETAPVMPHKPVNFELMKELAAKLSEGVPHLRVDFYEVDGKVYVGELTFFHCGGFSNFRPESAGKMFGDWIKLPEIKK